jgi:thioredoxin reductase/pSer/pThr/pTyr-binding forkhead associated (FHA) protein
MTHELTYEPDGTLALSKPAQLPDVLDLLVVGGGPAGTAAAFRATELGLSVLVIDYDDLLKRIRDYPKDKLILPDFGGGDQMRFPKGGELISALHFAPIDKDDLVQRWKQLYVEHSVPARIGVELLALQRSDSVWQVKVWNHNLKAEQQLRARHVAIGIGRGVPRRFDIPGNTDGIAYRLADAQAYVNGPALVIGGGTSAAEAVIAISNAKAKAQEPSAVYWSYRGDKLPKVSKALADVFFEAYMGNGNIRYFPNSEPVAVIAAEDGREYLSLRIDRKCIAGRPNETQHLEFPKERCIACIGEDIPEAFLNSLGIRMVEGGASKKKRMCVTRLLETQQPNVYLIGDILSQAYLEADDFAADPATFREVKHRGNIKSGMIDGVLVAEVVAQRVAGKKEIDVKIEFAEAAPVAEEPKPASPLATIFSTFKPAEPKAAAEPVARRAALVRLLPGGVEEEEYPLTLNGVTTIGRKFCTIVFPDDTNLSERHASVSHGPDGFTLRDDGSQNGVFLRLVEGKPREVTNGDLLRVGRQFLLVRIGESRKEILHYDRTGKLVATFAIDPARTVVLGREAPDITLDKTDMTLSRRHLSVGVKDGAVVVKDLKSVNGTYLRVRDSCVLEPGDVFRVGSQTFKLAVAEEKPMERIRVTTQPPVRPMPPPPVPQPIAEAPQPAGLTVTFAGTGKVCSFEPGQTLCAIAERHGVKIVAECHAGICGSDPIRVISGKDRLNPVSAEEKGTLEDLCGLTAGEYRLACMAKPTGSVEVEILSA